MSALSRAARRLIALRRYGEAATLLNRAGRESHEAASLLALAETVRKARRKEEIELPPGDPASVVRRFFLLSNEDDMDVQKILPLFTRDLAAELGSEAQRREFLRGVAVGRAAAIKRLKQESLPVTSLVELGLGALQQAVSGNDALGYRVELSSAASELRQSLFLVPDRGELRIAALSNVPAGEVRGAAAALLAESAAAPALPAL